MKRSKTYYFLLPEGTDKYNVEDQNDNWKKADDVLRNIKKALAWCRCLTVCMVMFICLNCFFESKNIEAIRRRC